MLMVSACRGLVFVILVIQFRAFCRRVLILLAAPLSLGGAFASC